MNDKNKSMDETRQMDLDFQMEDIIQDLMDADEPTAKPTAKSTPKTASKPKVERSENRVTRLQAERRKQIKYVIWGSKLALIGVILLFVISLFFPWFTLTGNGASMSFIQMTEQMRPDLDNQVILNQSFDAERVADFSPIALLSYSLRYRTTYPIYFNETAEQSTSTFSRLHLFYIGLFLAVIGGAIISIALLLLGKNFQFTQIVRAFSLMSVFTIIINTMSLKIPFFSMFAIRTQSILNVEFLEEARLVNNGILANETLYAYGAELLPAMRFGIIALVIWVILSAVMGEIMNKMDDYQRMTQA